MSKLPVSGIRLAIDRQWLHQWCTPTLVRAGLAAQPQRAGWEEGSAD